MRIHSLRLALVAATLVATSLVAHASPLATPDQDAPAQDRPRGGQRGPGGDMFKDLNLSADQKTKIDALMKEERGQRGPGQGQQGPPSDADRQAMQARRADMDAKLKGILTPEQYAKYQAQRPQGGPGKGGQRPARTE